jgi:hypothetical protein
VKCCSVRGEPPVCGVSSRRRDVESSDGWGEAPVRLCCHGGDCEATCEKFGSGVFTPSGWVWCRRGTSAKGPAWRRLCWCGAVCFLLGLVNATSRSNRYESIWQSRGFDNCMRVCWWWSHFKHQSGFGVSPLPSKVCRLLWLCWCPNPTGRHVERLSLLMSQFNRTSFICFFMFSFLWPFKVVVLYFFCFINETCTILWGSLRKRAEHTCGLQPHQHYQ